MPAAVAVFQVVSAMGAAVGIGAGATLAAAVVATTVYVGLYVGVLYAVSSTFSSIQKRKMKKAMDAMGSQNGAIDQGRRVMVRDPISPRRLIYGQIPVSGPIVFWHLDGTNNEYFYLIIVLASHECEELGEIKFEDTVVPLDGAGDATGTYAGYVRIKKFLGIAAGERDTQFEAELPSLWTANHLGKGVARLHVRLKNNPDLFVNGLPTISCMVKGKKVYDPRTATTYWSRNSALVFGDFLMDTKFGRGVPLARIVSADWIAAANVCDEDVVLADASTEKRYESDGAITSDQPVDGVLLDLAAAMAGGWSDPGGKWCIWAGAWRTPSLTLTDSDLCGSFLMTPRQSRQDTFNGVKGTYLSPINQWSPADFPAVKNDTYMGWDNGKRLWKDVVLNFTTSAARAQRLAKIDLEVGRQQIVFTGDYMLKAMQCQPGQVIKITRARLGWTDKYFEVDEWKFKVLEGDGGPRLAIGITGRETAEGVYDWADGEETTVDLAPNTGMSNPRSVTAPTTVTLSDDSFEQPDGTTLLRLKAAWTASVDSQVLKGGFAEVEYKKHADADYTPWSRLPGNRTTDYILDVEGGIQYDVRVKYVNRAGASSGWTVGTTGADGVESVILLPGQYVFNPDFTLGASTKYWDHAFGTSWQITSGDGEFSWGAKTLIEPPWQLVNQARFSVKAGERYSIRAHVKGTTTWARITVFDIGGVEVAYITTPVGLAGWGFVEAVGSVPASGVYARAEVLGGASDGWVDQVQITFIPAGQEYNDPTSSVPLPRWSYSGGNVTLVCDDGSATIKYVKNGVGPSTYSTPFAAASGNEIIFWGERGGYTTSPASRFIVP